MRTNNSAENKNSRNHDVEKRSLMYSQIFNYDMRRDGGRTIEVTAAAESGGRTDNDKLKYRLGLCVVIILIALVYGWYYVHADVAAALNDFILEKNNVQMQLTEPEFVELDVAAFMEQANESRDYYMGEAINETYYDQNYQFWSEVPMSDGTKEHIIEDSDLRFGYYTVAVYPTSKLGKVSVAVWGESTMFGRDEYDLSGTFKIADYSAEDTVLADKGKYATFIYESEGGNKAYFIRNWTYGTYTVYFETENILFEMEISASKGAVKDAKQIIEAMSE